MSIVQKEALEALIADLVTPLLDGTDLTLVDVEYVREKIGICVSTLINRVELKSTIAN